MEGDDHVLACLQIFRNNPIHWDWEVSVSYKLQRMLLHQPSLSPTPKSRRPWMTLLVPLIGAGRHYMITPLFYMLYITPTVAPSDCPLCSTVQLIDPAAAEFWKLTGCSFHQILWLTASD